MTCKKLRCLESRSVCVLPLADIRFYSYASITNFVCRRPFGRNYQLANGRYVEARTTDINYQQFNVRYDLDGTLYRPSGPGTEALKSRSLTLSRYCVYSCIILAYIWTAKLHPTCVWLRASFWGGRGMVLVSYSQR